MPERPWDKFYWADWLSNPKLAQCSFAAQGLWMRMLCICARSEPKGFLTVGGLPLDIQGLAVAVGKPVAEIEPLVAELERWRVFSRDRGGIIYSRRMVRDEKRSAEGRKHIQKRWEEERDPDLFSGKGATEAPLKRQQSQVTALQQPTESKAENPGPNRGPNRDPITHMPEARTRYRKKEPLRGSKESRDRKGSRWPPDKAVPEDWITWARDEEGLDDGRARREASKFADYWTSRTGQQATKRDWRATWRNWVRKVADDIAGGGTRKAASSSAEGKRSGGSSLVGSGLRAARRSAMGGDRS